MASRLFSGAPATWGKGLSVEQVARHPSSLHCGRSACKPPHSKVPSGTPDAAGLQPWLLTAGWGGGGWAGAVRTSLLLCVLRLAFSHQVSVNFDPHPTSYPEQEVWLTVSGWGETVPHCARPRCLTEPNKRRLSSGVFFPFISVCAPCTVLGLTQENNCQVLLYLGNIHSLPTCSSESPSPTPMPIHTSAHSLESPPLFCYIKYASIKKCRTHKLNGCRLYFQVWLISHNTVSRTHPMPTSLNIAWMLIKTQSCMCTTFLLSSVRQSL